MRTRTYCRQPAYFGNAKARLVARTAIVHIAIARNRAPVSALGFPVSARQTEITNLKFEDVIRSQPRPSRPIATITSGDFVFVDS
jgi:hypothetical protein